jgi:hypothetical protein
MPDRPLHSVYQRMTCPSFSQGAEQKAPPLGRVDALQLRTGMPRRAASRFAALGEPLMERWIMAFSLS